MTAVAPLDLHVGDRVYYRGRHYRVNAIRDGGRGCEVQLVPDGRKPHPFQFISLRSLHAASAVRSGT